MLDTIRSFFAPPITGGPQQNTTKVIWLVRLRWLALSAQLLSIGPALAFGVLEPRLVPLFFGAIVVLTVFNVLTWVALRRDWLFEPNQILIQLTADIAALSALLVLTGGAWNPMFSILFVHSVLGAMLLEGRASLIFFLLLLFSLALIQTTSHIPPRLEGSLLPAALLFPAQYLVALVFWILTAWLSRTLDSLQARVQKSREHQTRIDRLRAVGALAAGLSHEFATPLNTAQLRLGRLARSKGLEDDPDLETAREELGRCGEVLRHMAGSQLDPERLSLEVTNLDSLARQICSSIGKVHEDATVRFRTGGRGPRQALVPSVAFSQALINLIENAIESAGPNAEVDVTVVGAASHVDLSVSDRGAGWPEMVRKHIGEPFVTTKAHGVGLGLYYVHSLSEAIGARLTLEDRDDGGAVARISLPIPLSNDTANTEALA